MGRGGLTPLAVPSRFVFCRFVLKLSDHNFTKVCLMCLVSEIYLGVFEGACPLQILSVFEATVLKLVIC